MRLKTVNQYYNLINHAGGITAKAQPNIEFYQLKSFAERHSEDFAYEVFYSNLNEIESNLLAQLTKIRVLSVPDVTREVTIFGQVKIPGKYAYEDSMRILDLLKIAGGFDDISFLESIYTKEAEVIRQVSDSFYPKRIPINLE